MIADTAGKWPYQEDITSDFIYIRLHGDEDLYTSGYSDAALEHWKQRIKCWSEGRQVRDARLINGHRKSDRRKRSVYCYFDNDAKVRAPFDARRLLEKLGLDAELQTAPGEPWQ